MPRPGRKPLYDAAARKRLDLRITDRQHDALRRVAEAHGTAVSSLIRELIDDHLERATWDGDDDDR